MKNLSKLFVLGLIVLAGNAVMAESTQFTPLNFSDNTTVRPVSSTTAASVDAKGTDLLDASQVVAGSKMQNGILQIENAQVEIRNKLLNYKANYAEIDAKYNTTKAERKAAKKQIKYAEKKIKNLDNAKKKIKKNFQRNMNI